MSNEEWAKVQEGWHRKNLNKLYLKLKKGEPLDFTETERQYLCNALKWAGNEINYCYREMNLMMEHEGYTPGDSLLAWQID
jgi:hypothetical protein